MVTASCHHAHTRFVDGHNTPEEMAQAAADLGFVSLGLSEHARQDFDPVYGLSQQGEKEYVEQVLALKEKFAGRIALHLGLELDQQGRKGDYPYEYLIGAKHYLRLDQGWQAVDGALDQVKDMVRQRFGGDWVAMAAQYFDELADFICQTRPQVIGHFDLISKFNEGSALFDESSPAYVKAGCQALERMAGSGALLEVNTGAIGRGYRTQPYPAMPFLKRWRELGGGVILGSDCHDASWLAVGYDLAEARMRQAGYTSAWRLGREALFEPYAL